MRQENGFHRIYHKGPRMKSLPWSSDCGEITYQEYLVEKSEEWGLHTTDIFNAHLALYEWVRHVLKKDIQTLDLCHYVECAFASPEARTLPLSLKELTLYMAETHGVSSAV
jgi:hypothetical protein